jgi:uncharacterized protein (TIGR03083 family)
VTGTSTGPETTANVDLGRWYGDARQRITSLVVGGEHLGEVPVPATPGWDVHDLIAHVVGVVTDAVTGNMDGVTTDQWTAAQVERGRGRPIADLLDEWEAGSPLVEEFLSSSPADGTSTAARGVIDIHTHEADLLGALDRPIVLPAEVLTWGATLLAQEFHAAVASGGLPPVEVEASHLEWFRGRLGRRTVDEVCAYGWSRDPGPYLDLWFVFGRAEASLGERLA